MALNPEELIAKDAHVISINISPKKGTKKKSVGNREIEVLKDHGLELDAHAGNWHRQVSFLADESIQKVRDAGMDVVSGDFAENFTTVGINLKELPLGTILKVGEELEVEISQIGKVCHTRCAIYHLMGDCIFPREGIFAVVLKPGKVKAGDKIELIKLGDGTCSATPEEALQEIEEAKANGTL